MTTARSILQRGKIEKKVKDPVRFPKVIDGFENVAKKSYAVMLSKTYIEISKKLSEYAIK